MKKCAKCGTEFEGNCCPNCGTWAVEEKNCPKCGNKLKANANFCEWCGYSFGNSAAPKPQKPVELPKPVEQQKPAEVKKEASDFKEKLFRILKIVPAAAFALFSVLLFAFCAAPVAVVPIVGESYGSAFTVMNEIPDLKGEAIALIIFAVLSLLCAAAVWAVRYFKSTKFSRLKVFGKEMKLSEVCEFSSFVFYFIFFLFGCIICGKINTLDGGADFMSAGACPILVLVFAIIFALAGAGALVGRYFLKKKFPEYAQREEEEANAQFENYKTSIENIVKAGEPVKPQKVENPQAPLKAAKIVKSKMKPEIFAFFFIMAAGLAFTLALIAFDSVTIENNDDWYLNIIALVGMAVVAIVGVIIGVRVRVNEVNSKKIYKKGFLIFVAVISLCVIILAVPLIDMSRNDLKYSNGIFDEIYDHDTDEPTLIYYGDGYKLMIVLEFIVGGAIALCGLISFIWSLAAISKIKKIQKDTAFCQELNEELELYDKNKSEYAEYLKQSLEYQNQSKKYQQYVKVYEKIKPDVGGSSAE